MANHHFTNHSTYHSHPYLIDWDNSDSHLFLNPRFHEVDLNRMNDFYACQNEKSHLYVSTSGTSSINQHKLIALSKQAFLNSSLAVNAAFNIDKNDVLLNILPTFHVGGLSLFSRAYCAQAIIQNEWHPNYKWDPIQFANICQEKNATIISLVPTQIYDLIAHKIAAPKTLRAVFVGGGFFAKDLYLKGIELGWPLYPTYGMTECCSQVATLPYGFIDRSRDSVFELEILPHLNVVLNDEQRVIISGSSLLSYEIIFDADGYKINDPKVDGTFITNDIAQIQNNKITPLGRCDDLIKVKGEFVNLFKINIDFKDYLAQKNMHAESTIIGIPDDRLGQKLIAIFENQTQDLQNHYQNLVLDFNLQVLPYSRIEKIHVVSTIPKTELGKIQRQKLVQECYKFTI